MPKAKNEKIPKNEFSVNVIPRDEQKCIPACHTFYMSYDKNVKRMASMHICLRTSLHGYFFIKLQLHFHTTMNQYVNKSIRQRIIEASKKRPFSTPDFVTQKCPFCNWLINNILYLCIPLFWGTQKVF